MSRAYHTDILRSVKKGWKRFVAILVITALGVAMLTGLYAACLDMYLSADKFYDERNMFDIRILSTLGLTEEDAAALALLDGVESVEGAYSEIVYTKADGARKSAEMTVLSASGLNRPYLLDGAFPSGSGEIAVTQKYLDETGKRVGDTLTIEEELGKDGSGDAEPASDGKGSGSDTDMEFDGLEEETEAPTFPNTIYTITGVVLDPMDIQKSGGYTSSFRSTAASDYTFFVTAEDARSDIYTAVYLVLSNTKGMNCFSDEYEDAVQAAIRDIDANIKVGREQARYDSVLLEARTKIQDAEGDMLDKFAEADKEFSDARQDIEEARRELEDGEAELVREEQNARLKISDARAQLEKAKQELTDAEKRLADGEAQLAKGEAELARNEREHAESRQRLSVERKDAEKQLADAERQLLDTQNELDVARAQLEPAVTQMKESFGAMWPEKEWTALTAAASVLAASGADDAAIYESTASERAAVAEALHVQADEVISAGLGTGKINGGQQALDAQKSAFAKQRNDALQKFADAEAQLASGEARIEEARRTLDAKKSELTSGKSELANGRAELEESEATLNAEEADANTKIADARQEIADGWRELTDGEAELREQEREYEDKKLEARRKLDDAYAKLNDIDTATWYVQDRSSLNSHSSLSSDLSSIEAVGRVFPVIFLLVAVLMSLTTMTRMVEEERGLIGTYKALGYSNGSIYLKYILFAFMACLLGGILGDALGFIFFPEFVSVIMGDMYSLPEFFLGFDFMYGLGGIVLFMVGIVGATALACRNELSRTPASLMRPKAPRAGARVFLERVPILWNRLGFLRKITVRNLFRYKKRLFMTVGGIMGCTALILCGFAIKDSIAALAPKQYEKIYLYDLMTVLEDDANGELTAQLSSDGNVGDFINLRVDSVKLINSEGKSERVQLFVVPNGSSISEYIRTESPDGTPVNPDDGGILVTQNAARLLGLEAGGSVSLQDAQLVSHEAAVTGVVKNYLGNNVYMTQKLYEELFCEYVHNGVLAHLTEECKDHSAYAQTLRDRDSVLSAVSTEALRDKFGFDLIDAVVLLITAMASGLAFVVLFTLSNTNISERSRELATIKVLGFYDGEVHQYVNKETLILTAAGILLGLPAGRILSGFLTVVLNMPSIHFAVQVEPVSYLITAAATFAFAVIVNLATNRTLDRINMVEALKSVE